MNEVSFIPPGWIDGLPVLEVLCEKPNPYSPNTHVLMFIWCKYCKCLHQHGDRRIHHEEYVARMSHCNTSSNSPYSGESYLLHRVPGLRMHTQDGVTAPVVEAVIRKHNDRVSVVCPQCYKKHLHHVPEGEEYTLKLAHCSEPKHPRYFVHQEVVSSPMKAGLFRWNKSMTAQIALCKHWLKHCRRAKTKSRDGGHCYTMAARYYHTDIEAKSFTVAASELGYEANRHYFWDISVKGERRGQLFNEYAPPEQRLAELMALEQTPEKNLSVVSFI